MKRSTYKRSNEQNKQSKKAPIKLYISSPQIRDYRTQRSVV